MTFTEILTSTGFIKGTAHRIISILLDEDLIHFDAATKSYYLGAGPMKWARAAWHKMNPKQITDAALVELRNLTELNVAVSGPMDGSIMFRKARGQLTRSNGQNLAAIWAHGQLVRLIPLPWRFLNRPLFAGGARSSAG